MRLPEVVIVGTGGTGSYVLDAVAKTEVAEIDLYDGNVLVELNMLNAALVVIRWKKVFGFYNDLEKESSSLYTIDGNHIANEASDGTAC